MRFPRLASWRGLLPAVGAVVLLLGPALPSALRVGRPGLSPDAGVLLALLGVAALRWPRGQGTAGISWRAWSVGLAWALLVAFEIEHAVAWFATSENLPMYDAALLSRHLFVLARDLYGIWASVAVFGIVVAPFALWAVGAFLADAVERELGRIGGRAGVATVVVLLAVGLAGLGLRGGRFATVRIARNAATSWTLYRGVSETLAARAHTELAPLAGLSLAARPDVVFLVIESYGRVVADDPAYRTEWIDTVRRVEDVLSDRGWTAASTWVASPVRGGRSWIADASLLLGLPLAHESEYEHVLGNVDELPSMVRFFDQQGYTTVLVKPSDRERPGVALENPFGFERTVFAADLGYTGPIIGWGRIPDQYTLGWVGDALRGFTGPSFVFVHLATSHVPWTSAPPVFDDWRQWSTTYGSKEPIRPDKDLEDELSMRLGRFRRKVDGEGPGYDPTDAQRQNYLDDVTYDLRSIGAELARPFPRPTIAVVMGDHQPPVVVADGSGSDVPVHVWVNDPVLLAPFVAAGFAPGANLDLDETSTLRHADLFPMLARALAALPAPEPPAATP